MTLRGRRRRTDRLPPPADAGEALAGWVRRAAARSGVMMSAHRPWHTAGGVLLGRKGSPPKPLLNARSMTPDRVQATALPKPGL